MAIYTLDGTDKEISVQGRYASVKNNGSETVYASSTSDLSLEAPDIVPIQAGESVVVRDCKKKLYVRGGGQIAVVSGNEPFNFFKPAPKGGGGGSGGGITQQQLNDTLKSYATIASVDTKLEGYAEKDEIPTSLPADGGNADTVGGYTAEQLIQSNPNLLLNPNFRINQRGLTECSTGYFVDRWSVSSKATLNDDGSVTSTGHFQQILDPKIVKFLIGKKVTYSAKVKNLDEPVYMTFVVNTSMTTWDTQAHVSIPSGGYILFACVSPEAALVYADGNTFEWVKLELGSVPTPFVPPNPATELTKCQRYYQRMGLPYNFIGTGFISAKTQAVIMIPLPTQLRIEPTVSIVGTLFLWAKYHNGADGIQVTSFGGTQQGDAIVSGALVIDNSDETLVGTPCLLQSRSTDAYIELSADL